ncbi:MAG: glycoside hydrolase family 3 C-terminal domain-containing protein [Clostridia bacterium]|nr:glycoside hydrolase family 3 C-terminal domain-containing protein [Clostridia bacterium]
MNRRFIISTAILTALLIIFAVVLNVLAFGVYDTYLTHVFGSTESGKTEIITAHDLEYHKSGYATEQVMQRKLGELQREISDESIVLLENNNCLPLPVGTKIDVYGAGAIYFDYGETSGEPTTLIQALTSEGYTVNAELWDYYLDNAREYTGAFDELPIDLLRREVGEEGKSGVAIYALTRPPIDGEDAPRGMYDLASREEDKPKHYLQPSVTELETLELLSEIYDKIIVIINSSNPFETSEIKAFSAVKAMLVVSQPGEDGLSSLSSVLSGEVSPSGKLTDTWARDNLSAPSAENFGDFVFTKDGTRTSYGYVTHAEGVYVGYRYYETRYEDYVTERAGVGEFDYGNVVCYPFGYGKSYATFERYGMSLSHGEEITVSVRVRNTSEYFSGKEAVGLYLSAPYNEYNAEKGLERPSVTLVGYEKTAELQPNEEENLTFTLSLSDLAVYSGAESGYVTQAGRYYFTVASNAHEAVNNVLAVKYNEKPFDLSRMYGAGEADSVRYVDVATTSVSRRDAYSERDVNNRFDGIAPEKKLSRADWAGTYPTADGTQSTTPSAYNERTREDGRGYGYEKVLSQEAYNALSSANSGAPDSVMTVPKIGLDTGIETVDVRGLPLLDQKWAELLSNLSASSINSVVTRSAYGFPYTSEINAPRATYGGNAYGVTEDDLICAPLALAQTFNKNLADRVGAMAGELCMRRGVNGWYAPSPDVHRSPFGGKNAESYSEDPYFSGEVALRLTVGSAQKGVFAFIGSLGVNAQITRLYDGLSVYVDESTLREIYLKPFERAVKSGKTTIIYYDISDEDYIQRQAEVPVATAIRSSPCRIGETWAGGSYALLSNLLRGEWGYEGFVLSDGNESYMNVAQMLKAGGDCLSGFVTSTIDVTRSDLLPLSISAVKNVLYASVNSSLMNGYIHGVEYVPGIPYYVFGVIAIDLLFLVALITLTVRAIRRIKNRHKGFIIE